MKTNLKRSLEIHNFLVENGATLSANTLDLLDEWFRRSASRNKKGMCHIYILKLLTYRTLTPDTLLSEAQRSRPNSAPFVLQRAEELVQMGLVTIIGGQFDITEAGENYLTKLNS